MAKVDVLVRAWVEDDAVHLGGTGKISSMVLHRVLGVSGASFERDALKSMEHQAALESLLYFYTELCDILGLPFENHTKWKPFPSDRMVDVINRVRDTVTEPANVEKYQEMLDMIRLESFDPFEDNE